MIEVEHLTKRFGDRLALDDVSFRVSAGKVTGFLGPNGAGKTTAMRLLLGLDRPTTGRALIDGRPLRDYHDPLCQVGALLDAKFAHPRRTAFDHLLVVAATHGIPRSRVHDVIDETGLDSVAGERVGKFSLGMTQRLGIASALLGSPRALILDEPINGLDIDGVRWFRELCREYADAGAAVFLSSHLMSEVELVADHVIVLGRGRVLRDAPLRDFHAGAAAVEVVADRAAELAAILTGRGATVE
ncbi:MAG: ATP-binding cassette domain-containing protein, partial [Microbacterium sp.]